MSDDNTRARNLTDSLFGDLGLDLPQQSSIQRKTSPASSIPNNIPAQNLTVFKYADDDDDGWNIQLAAVSNIPYKPKSKQIQTKQQQTYKASTSSAQPSNSAVRGPVSKIQRRPRDKPQKKQQQKPQVDIDAEIGEIAQWAQRGAKNNSDDQDFNEGPQMAETEQQMEIRKRLEDKLRSGQTQKQGGLGGLKAKAEQLRRENQNKNVAEQNNQKQQRQMLDKMSQVKKDTSRRIQETTQQSQNRKRTTPSQKIKPTGQQQKVSHNDSTTNLMQHNRKQQQKRVQFNKQQSQDDPWQRVNQNTKQQFQKNAQKRKNMTLDTALGYYQQFAFDPAQIDDDDIGGNVKQQQQEQQQSFFARMCACLKPTRKRQAKFNADIAKRLVAISRKQLSNGQQQFFILKEIWVKLAKSSFSRYGSHWNQIGFQGRDPATDLRSTGVLSLVQWAAFMQAHQTLAVKYSCWGKQIQFPLALCHIKLTGVFLQLLSKGAIRCQQWKQYQNSYNCLVIGLFGKLMKTFKMGDDLDTLVEDQAKIVKSNYKRLLVVYEREYLPHKK